MNSNTNFKNLDSKLFETSFGTFAEENLYPKSQGFEVNDYEWCVILRIQLTPIPCDLNHILINYAYTMYTNVFKYVT